MFKMFNVGFIGPTILTELHRVQNQSHDFTCTITPTAKHDGTGRLVQLREDPLNSLLVSLEIFIGLLIEKTVLRLN